METSEARTAVRAAMSIVSSLGLVADDAVVLRDSDKLTLRVLPCDVVARIAHVGHEVAEFEVELARRLAASESPVARLDPRVEPRVYVRDGFAVTLWTYYEALPRQHIEPAEYARALERMHDGLRRINMQAPRFTDRVAEAQSLLAHRDRTPDLADGDRDLLSNTLRTLSLAIEDRGAPEQLLHGEPHPGNVMSTKDGLVFIDLETCCRGPVEFDIAHAVDLEGSRPDLEPVSERYPKADRELVALCRVLMLAMITTWRWNREDQLPDRRRLRVEWITKLREALNAIGDDPTRVQANTER
jgi:Ser/Thr protein kinase RdoA (MazF antagonist)